MAVLAVGVRLRRFGDLHMWERFRYRKSPGHVRRKLMCIINATWVECSVSSACT